MTHSSTPNTLSSYVRTREIVLSAAEGLGRLPTELLQLIVEHLPPQDQARLALTNNHYFERIGTRGWRNMRGRGYETGRMEYLCSIERDSEALGRTAAQLLACSHCAVSHDAKRFDFEERVKEPMSRICYLKYGEVVICNQLQLTWAEMLEIPDYTQLHHYYKVKIPYNFFDEDSEANYRGLVGTPVPGRVEVDLRKIDSTIYVRTRYEFLAAMKRTILKTGFIFPSGGMSVALPTPSLESLPKCVSMRTKSWRREMPLQMQILQDGV